MPSNGMWGWSIFSLIIVQLTESSTPLCLNLFCLMLELVSLHRMVSIRCVVIFHQIMNANNDAIQHRLAGQWNLIWNLKLLIKVKNFLWRVCRNCLPTRLRLKSRGVLCQGSCVVCTIHHKNMA